MLTKQKKVGQGRYVVTKAVLDWDAIWGWIITIGVAVMLLKACS